MPKTYRLKYNLPNGACAYGAQAYDDLDEALDVAGIVNGEAEGMSAEVIENGNCPACGIGNMIAEITTDDIIYDCSVCQYARIDHNTIF